MPVAGPRNSYCSHGLECAFEQALLADERIFGLIDFGREVIGATPVGVEFLHQVAVCCANVVYAGTALETEDRKRLLASHHAASRLRVRSRHILLPAGMRAIEVGLNQLRRFWVNEPAVAPQQDKLSWRETFYGLICADTFQHTAPYRASFKVEFHLESISHNSRGLAGRWLTAICLQAKQRRPRAEQQHETDGRKRRGKKYPAPQYEGGCTGECNCASRIAQSPREDRWVGPHETLEHDQPDDQRAEVNDLTKRAGIAPTITRVDSDHVLLTELAPGERVFVTAPPERIVPVQAPGRGSAPSARPSGHRGAAAPGPRRGSGGGGWARPSGRAAAPRSRPR